MFVDAVTDTLGPNGGSYLHISTLEEGVAYRLTIVGGTAVFNTVRYGEMVNVGVMYVEPPRKMRIQSIEIGFPSYVVTEGNLYLFFVDNAINNPGGFDVRIEEISLPVDCQTIFKDSFECETP